jgi:hypothetical protein
MFRVEAALNDAALSERLCDCDHGTRRQHPAMAVARHHAIVPT